MNNTPRIAFFSPRSGGYGNRLFVPDEDNPANHLLKELSIWRGADKHWIIDGVYHLGYEFANKDWEEVRLEVAREGIDIQLFSTRNKVTAAV